MELSVQNNDNKFSNNFFERLCNASTQEVPKRVILPDPKYKDVDVSKFVNVVVLHGKKPLLKE